MASVYAVLAKTAQALIAKYGRPLVVVSVADGDPSTKDPARPWEPAAQVETQYATTGVFAKVSKDFVNGTTILESDETVLVPALDVPVEITSKDYLLDGSTPVAIIKSEPIAPGDTALVLQLIVRR